MSLVKTKFIFEYLTKCCFGKIKFHLKSKQAGAELGQAQLKLELELCYTSFEILSYRLLQLVVVSD